MRKISKAIQCPERYITLHFEAKAVLYKYSTVLTILLHFYDLTELWQITPLHRCIRCILTFFQNFGKRLACNTKCESLSPGSAEREACEAENCIEIVSEDTAEGRGEEEDEYDYSYGYDDETLNEVDDEAAAA